MPTVRSVANVRAIEAGDADLRFGLFEGAQKVGQFDLRIEPTVPDDEWLGELPRLEMFLTGLELPWEREWFGTGTTLISEAIAGLPQTTPSVVQANTNVEVHEHPWRRIHLFEALGFELFQEKHGYLWVDRGETLDPGLETRSLAEAGEDSYRSVLSRIPAGGLDRNDNYYYGAAGAENWARVMTTFLTTEDRASCLIGYDGGQPVGVVGLSAFDEDATGTISYIGVVPEQRGRGFGRRLLTAATAAARSRDFKQILSDVDVHNVPMRTAMVACGHEPDRRPWHRWAHWLQLR